jgi:RNA polymerase sigma-70 factor (ECF subfamily)
VGETTAADLFGRHYRDLYRFLLRMTGRREEADDLAQDVFLHVVRALRNGGPTAHERGWVFSIARNLLTDRHRSDARQVTATRAPAEPAKDATQALSVSLAESIGRLAEADREVFLLREIAGLSYQEIADTCGCTADAVRCRLHRSRVALRAMLADTR